jgi:hypothetical protein
VNDLTSLENLKHYFLSELPAKMRRWIYQVDNVGEIVKSNVRRLNEYKGDSVIPDIEKLSHSDGFCGSISEVVHEALKYFNIKSTIYLIGIMVGNEAARKILKEKGMKGLVEEKNARKNDEYREGDSWTIGVGFSNNPEDFHAILRIENDESVLDMTASQLDRPEKGITVSNYWIKKEGEMQRSILYIAPKIQERNAHFLISKHPRIHHIIAEVRRDIKQRLVEDGIEIRSKKEP